MTERSVPLVFLDVDGVLCLGNEQQLENAPLCALQHLCASASADVVVTSDWRRDPALLAELTAALSRRGIRCAGQTPQRSRYQELRPVEIREWFEANGGADNRAWVALDDRHLPEETGGDFVGATHFVLVDPRYGLTTALSKAAAASLRRQQGLPPRGWRRRLRLALGSWSWTCLGQARQTSGRQQGVGERHGHREAGHVEPG